MLRAHGPVEQSPFSSVLKLLLGHQEVDGLLDCEFTETQPQHLRGEPLLTDMTADGHSALDLLLDPHDLFAVSAHQLQATTPFQYVNFYTCTLFSS